METAASIAHSWNSCRSTAVCADQQSAHDSRYSRQDQEPTSTEFMSSTADVVICGAGIAGITAAHALAVRYGVRNVVLVDERPPMTLTSDKSSEAYRNWWPGPDESMLAFMNHSIDLIEQFAQDENNRIRLNRRGYFYATADSHNARQLLSNAETARQQGAGDVRIYNSPAETNSYAPSTHTGFENHPDGADIFLGHDTVQHVFPTFAPDITAVLHARKCGWFSGQQLGMQLLEQAAAAGVTYINGKISAVNTTGGRVHSVTVAANTGITEVISCGNFVNCAGPYAKNIARLIGVELPLFSELHQKVAFDDQLGAIDRNTGLVILNDEQLLDLNEEVRQELSENEETRWLTKTLAPGVHFRPEGYNNSKTVLMLWSLHTDRTYDEPVFPLPEDPVLAEVVMRGMSRLIPGLKPYVDHMPRVFIDGGYYTKTIENRPLIGALPVEGAWIAAAYSGFGLMASPAGGDLIAKQIAGETLPAYTSAFSPARYDDPQYQTMLKAWSASGQL